jgi:hypothetical protein
LKPKAHQSNRGFVVLGHGLPDPEIAGMGAPDELFMEGLARFVGAGHRHQPHLLLLGSGRPIIPM